MANIKAKARMEDVFATYIKMDQPTIPGAFEKYLKENPTKTISLISVKRWAAKYKWLDKAIANDPTMPHPGYESKEHHGSPVKVRKAKAAKSPYKDDIKLATPETIKALQGKILDKMHTELGLINIDSTDKLSDMLAIVGRMQTLEHEFRGNMFAGQADAPSEGNLPESPVVDFKTVAAQVRKSTG